MRFSTFFAIFATMKEIVLYIATSLDGYVADPQGDVSWLVGDGSEPENVGTYPAFYEQVDTVVLGYSTYHQVVTELSPDSWVYAGKQSYVITHRAEQSTDQITFTNEDPCALIERLRSLDGEGKVWICGGASIAQQLIEANLIDRYRIAVIPTILGKGIRLWAELSSPLNLKLEATHSYNGMCEMEYSRR